MKHTLHHLHITPNHSQIFPNTGHIFPVSAYYGNLADYVTHEIPWHWHKEIEALVVIKGTCRAYLGKYCISVPTGYGLFCNSNVLHRLAIDGDENCIFHSIVVDPVVIGGNAESVFSQKYVFPLIKAHNLPYVFFSPNEEWQLSCLESIKIAHQACTAMYEGYEFTIREEISKLWFLVLQHYQEQIFSSDNSFPVDARRIHTFLDYIHNHYQEQITINDLANTANICPRECQRCFKKALHMTPTKYILKYRLELSVNMLMDTDLSITEICYAVGFNSPSYFSKIFRKHFGISPNEYRKNKNRES